MGGTRVAIRVLVVDDQVVVRRGLRAVLDAAPDVVVVGEAGDGAAAVREAQRLRPDVMLMDVRMPGLGGIEAVRRLVELFGDAVRILVVTTFDLDEYVFESLRAGARGFVLKDIEPEALVTAVRALHAGKTVLDPSITGRVTEEFVRLAAGQGVPVPTARPDPPVDELSARQREVVALVARGRSNAEIAAQLHLSETTVKTHVSTVLAKWGLRDRVQLVVRAFETGVVLLDRGEV